MYKVLKNECIADNIYLLEVEAKNVVESCVPGQFVIIMPHEKSERIPLTIYDFDKKNNILKIIYQVVGYTTKELSSINDSLFAVCGPLGNKGLLLEKIDEYKNKKIVLVGGGIGMASIYPQAKYLSDLGIDFSIVYGCKNRESVLIEDRLSDLTNNLIITTDDGSYGIKGNVLNALENMDYDICLAIGPMIMMNGVTVYNNERGIDTIVSMNPIMVDGTGMCGACRLSIKGNIKFACIDGPEFFGNDVNFDEVMKRMKMYKTFEGRAMLKEIEGKTHHGGCGSCGDNHE